MKETAIFLDRDGTINVDNGYLYKIKDLNFINKSIGGLKLMQKANYKLIIVTNQSGIARGYYTEEDYFSFRNEMHKQLKEQGIIINSEYFCPHHPEGIIGQYKIDCQCRKPKIGMLEQAARDFNLDLRKCWMIGDALSDIQAGKNAGCKTIQMLTGKEKIKFNKSDFIAKDLIEAANYILNV